MLCYLDPCEQNLRSFRILLNIIVTSETITANVIIMTEEAGHALMHMTYNCRSGTGRGKEMRNEGGGLRKRSSDEVDGVLDEYQMEKDPVDTEGGAAEKTEQKEKEEVLEPEPEPKFEPEPEPESQPQPQL